VPRRRRRSTLEREWWRSADEALASVEGVGFDGEADDDDADGVADGGETKVESILPSMPLRPDVLVVGVLVW
jgi:hypothetical protein